MVALASGERSSHPAVVRTEAEGVMVAVCGSKRMLL